MNRENAQVNAEGVLHISGNVKLVLKSEAEIVVFRESEERGRGTSADVQPAGSVILRNQGTPDREQDTLRAGQIFVEALNADGSEWAPPEPSEIGAADCIISHTIDPLMTFEIQVERAIADERYYHAWHTQGKVEEISVDAGRLAGRLRAAIARKSDDRRLPPGVRKSLVLVLDATRISALALPSVVAAFRTCYREWTAQRGFKQVWLVGPTAEMTSRLDS